MIASNSLHAKRQASLLEGLAAAQLNAVVLNAGPSLRYFTGLDFHLMERPVLFFLKPGQTPTIVLPSFEEGKLSSVDFDLRAFTYSEDPAQWAASFAEAAQALDLGADKVGLEDTQLRFLELSYLQAAAPQAGFVGALDAIGAVRERKGPEEVEAMRRAARLAEQALMNTLEEFKVGQTEKEISSRLVMELLSLGSDPELPFFPIVASGPNSANPHSSVSERPVHEGDLLLIDWGANVDGYLSDITRTFAVGEIDEELKVIYEAVRAANKAGRQQVAPGNTASSVDEAARAVIEEADYGEFFTHRTGHGLGLEAHEAPYMRAGNKKVLQPGMTFTVEPGIYLSGRGGVRIEDNVAVSQDGVDVLTSFPRELQVLG